MSSKTANPVMRSAAWRISFWPTLAFALGTLAVFVFLHRFMARDIQRRTDAWLAGEVDVLSDVAEHTPKNALHDRLVSEVAELASREVPNRATGSSPTGDDVFFLQTDNYGTPQLWVGASSKETVSAALRKHPIPQDQTADIALPDNPIPFRVAVQEAEDGSRIYLGLSERDELRVLDRLRGRFMAMWLTLAFLGFTIVFYTTRRMLRHVQRITEAASQIGHADLGARVPTTRHNDEVGLLAETLNRMLDRIENSMHQLHTITDSLAHDLRSPLTAIRGKLEMSLTAPPDEHAETLEAAIDELDRLTDFLNTSLDVAEGKADALRLSRRPLDLDELVRAMIDLYEPSMAEKGLQIRIDSEGPLWIEADAALIHRMIANLFDNEMRHLPAQCAVTVALSAADETATLRLEDDGPGFSEEVRPFLFEQRVKGKNSSGHGLGLAFVDAVVRAHGGHVIAENRDRGGARITLTLPIAVELVA